MSNIDNLNFGVIAKDAGFDKKLEELENRAKRFNTSVTKLLELDIKAHQVITKAGADNLDRAAGAIERIHGAMDGMPSTIKVVNESAEKAVEATEKGAEAEKRRGDEVRKTNTALGGSVDLMSKLTQLTGVALGVAGVRRFLGDLVEVSGQFEVQKMALTSMLQDAGKADKIFADLRANALESPYTFQDLSKYAKQLTAFNIDADQLVETEKRLADVAAGLGVDMGRIILAYGQVKSAGVLKGTELRQFTEAGVPLLQSLADQIERTEGKAVSLSEVFDRISKKQIPFEMVEQAFRDMTDEGGKFYNMQETLVETLQGKIGKLRDVWQQVLYDVGSSTDLLKWGVDALTTAVSNLGKFGGVIKSLVIGVGAYGAALAIVGAAQKVAFGIEVITNISNYIKQIKAATVATEGFALAQRLASPLAFALGALAAAGYGLYKAYEKAHAAQNRLNTAMETSDKQIDDEIGKLDELKAKLNSATKGTEEYENAKKEIVQNYGKYYDGLDAEIDKVGDLTTAYDTLTEAIRDSLRERQYQEFEKEEKRILDEAIGTALDAASRKAYKKLGRAGGYALMSKLRTAIENGDGYSSFMSQFDTADRMRWGPGIENRIAKVFSVASKYRDDYLKNTRAMIKEYGLDGSKYDPDFIGPILLGGGARNSGKTPATWLNGGDGKSKDDDSDDEIKRLKQRIELLKKYKEVYESLSELVGPEYAKGLTSDVFKVSFDDYDFTAQIKALADAMRELGDEEGADSVLASIGAGEGKDLEKNLKKVQQVAKSYKDLITAWSAKDTDVEDTTFFGNMEKTVSDLNTKINELHAKGDKAKELLSGIDIGDPVQKAAVLKALTDSGMSEDAANQFWEAWVKGGRFAIDRLVADETNKLIAVTQKSLNDKAKDYVKDKTSGMSLKDWGDKSIGQVYKLWKDLEKLSGEDVYIDDKLKERIYKAGLTLKDFTKMTKEEFGKLSDEAKTELVKKMGAALKQLISDLNSTAQAVVDFADATGNDALDNVAEAFMEVSSIVSGVGERLAQGDILGAVAAGITSVANGLLNAATAAARFKSELAAAREEARKLRFEQELSERTDSVFGTNDMRKVSNAISNMEKARKAMADLTGSKPSSMRMKNSFWDRFLHGFGSGTKYDRYSLEDMAKSVGRDLYDQYGNLNADTLQAILDKYTDLKTADREWIEQAITNSEAYSEAMEQLDGVMESVFGDIASSAADSIVDGWIEAGNAALDYADILDDVAKSYSKMLIKSMIMDEVFNDETTKAIKDAFMGNDYDSAMRLVSDAMGRVEDMSPVLEGLLTAFDPYFKGGDSERSASSKALTSNFSQDTIDYWSGQLTLLVEFARRNDDHWNASAGVLAALRDSMGDNRTYMADIQAYLVGIRDDTSAMRGDIRSLKVAVQDMNDKGIKMR